MIRLVQHKYDSETKTLPGVKPASLKLIFVDPPYNIGVRYADDRTRDRLPLAQYVVWCTEVMQILSHYLAPGGTLWWLCPASHMDWVPKWLTLYVGPMLYRIVKQETFAQYQQTTLTEDFRMLFCVQKPGGDLTFNPDAIRIPSARQEIYGDKRADPRGRVPGQVWTIRRLQGTASERVDWHKAQLPPELLDRIVQGWSNEGDLCMDAFAGSGSMGLVCGRRKRPFIGVDGSPTYIGKMKERFESLKWQVEVSS
jgi:hypothetical protein